jgi:predicted nuclease of predicted toxin-antitoxin system
MRLLFDQNLSPRLPRLLADLYPNSTHVREVGLRDASDVEIWEYAKQNGFVIVSKDSDFQQRSLLHGHPPKIHLAPCRQLPSEGHRRLIKKPIGRHPQLRSRQHQVSPDASVSLH